MDRSLCARATEQAWTIYLARNNKVAPADERRCTLERFIRGRWQAGEADLNELTCAGLSFLSRLDVLPERS
ncbi:hypothetical protein [Bradyrhizobium sp. BWA-3-5]|uniref:hypothetical protein n=1 Tax=Bradyrhizobium sp. BWA-3-5 TaxID=3080013 RepID=UPI00293E6003|nr:hypothetical protein [Bradyrhizobium sp. BWA-3-5]WOH67650.1 hypothetical protein RX331_07845 [Bradyrhizobium sp. BWA-3-5]